MGTNEDSEVDERAIEPTAPMDAENPYMEERRELAAAVNFEESRIRGKQVSKRLEGRRIKEIRSEISMSKGRERGHEGG